MMSPRSREANQEVLDKRRAQIMKAALKVFAEQGFSATKISRIASEAGLSHGLIYHYFNTKDDIFIELVRNASNIFLKISEYGSKYDTSPIEKIRIITEMIISIGYSAASAYHLNIFEQAYISEGIPDTAREIINENLTSNINLITGIIKEGQKQGQIIKDDPLKLSFAFYAMVRGMTGMQSKSIDFNNKPVSFSDSEIIMRTIRNPEYNENIRSFIETGNIFGPLQSIGKSLVYRHREHPKAKFKVYRETAGKVSIKGKEQLKIVLEMDAGEKMISLVNPDNWLPSKIEHLDSNGKKIHATEYKNDSVVFDTPEYKYKKEIRLNGLYYDHNTLPYFLQSYPFENNKNIRVTLILDGSMGLPIGPYGIEIENLGIESVSVPAGDFDCYKLEISPVGFDISKFYYWYPVEEPRYLVKRDLFGMETELLEIG